MLYVSMTMNFFFILITPAQSGSKPRGGRKKKKKKKKIQFFSYQETVGDFSAMSASERYCGGALSFLSIAWSLCVLALAGIVGLLGIVDESKVVEIILQHFLT
jgi:hypothetical protein